MKKSFIILLSLISLLLTIFFSMLIPADYFSKHKILLQNTYNKYTDQEYFFTDLDFDGFIEKIEYCKFVSPGHSLNFRHDKLMLNLYNLQNDELFISKDIKFADLNNNNNQEIYFLTAYENKIYFYCTEFNFERNILQVLQKVEIDTFSYYNGTADVVNYDMVFSGKNIIFDLQAGFSVQPRNTYIFNIETQKIKKATKNSISNSMLKISEFNKKYFILPAKIFASGNTISPKEFESYQYSKNQDTVDIFLKKKADVYQFGDFSAYTILYDSNLNFVFEPKEFYGWTSLSLSDFVYIDKIPYIATCVYNYHDTSNIPKLLIFDINGNIIKETKLEDNYSGIFTDENKIVLWGENRLEIYNIDDQDLYPKNVENIDYSFGYQEIDNDKNKEFIAISGNKLIIFENNFKHKTEFKIPECNNPNFALKKLYTYTNNGKTFFYFYSDSFYYVFTYQKNNFSVFKFPFYIFIFSIWFLLLLFLVKLYSKRLEKENIRLENLVTKRTYELKQKNIELHSQKEEILSQTEKLLEQKQNLEELGEFKKTLTNTLVHDLKNPLSQILNQSSDKNIKNSAGKMLRLVMNILDVEKYSKIQINICKENHSLRSILNKVYDDLEVQFVQKNITFKPDFSDFEVYADAEILTRIFENLISNAIRFSLQNSEIKIIADSSENNIVKIQVKNYGEKIPENLLENIFDKFVQAKVKDSSGFKTSGLGLSFCKMAVEVHGHNIFAKNFEQGVIFEFSLDGKPSQTEIIKNTDEKNVEFLFSQSEISYLQPFIVKLKQTEIFNISEIIKILNLIENQTTNIENWKTKLKTAAFSINTDYFQNLLDFFKISN